MASNTSNQPASFSDMINKVQAQIDEMGPGPHTEQQKEKINTLHLLLAKAKQENMKTPTGAYQATPLQQQLQQHPQPQLQPGAVAVAGLPSVHTQQQGNPLPQQIKLPAVPSNQANVSVDQSDTSTPSTHKILDKKRLQELVKEIDPMAQLEDEVEEVLMQIADDFIENVVTASCEIAKHRHSETLEVKDVQLYLDRGWNMWVPGFSTDELRPYKKAPATEAHKQRMALIKKTLKKS